MSRAERVARNETARAENEHRAAWFHGHGRVAFVCECADPDCSETLSLDREAYTALRASPIQFGVAPGHDAPAVERVLERHEGYWVIEKVGEGAEAIREAAEEDSPR